MLDLRSNELSFVIFVNGETRRSLWHSLRTIAGIITIPWLVLGDFNAFMSSSDKLGGSPLLNRSMEEFNDSIIDIGLLEEKFTWEKKHVKERLDWAFGNLMWTMKYPQRKESFSQTEI